MTLLVAFLFGSLLLGIRSAEAPERPRLRLLLVAATVLALAYTRQRFI